MNAAIPRPSPGKRRRGGPGARGAAAWLLALTLLCGAGDGAETPATAAAAPTTRSAIFAGGCFWCVERDFEQLDGVIEAESGYTGGRTANPSYEQVSYGYTGHVEAVRVIYDPARVSYQRLLDYFWRHIDPSTPNGQFCDRGPEYRSVIFWGNDEERKAAEASREALVKSGRFPAVYTELAAAATFWRAEPEHQDYYKRNPLRYNYYRFACGRDARVKALWGDG